MKAILTSALLLGFVASAFAQTPDVAIKLDLKPTLVWREGGTAKLTWYDRMARPSTIGLSFLLEPGNRAFISQRLQRIPNDGDDEALLEYYVENPGSWRMGKQAMPFGAGVLFRQYVRGATVDTSLAFGDFPVQVGACDAGGGRTRGAIGRVGPRQFGLSAAIGDHFGIASTALAPVRLPEEAPGTDRGWRTALGFDTQWTLGPMRLVGEGLLLRRGHTRADRDEEVADLSLTGRLPAAGIRWSAGISREFRAARTTLRAEVATQLSRGFSARFFARARNGGANDFGLTAEFKL